MAITLTQFGGVGVGSIQPPITAAKIKTFYDLYGILAELNKRELKLIGIRGMITSCSSSGGTDYSSNLSGLATDAEAVVGKEGPGVLQLDIMQAAADWNQGKTESAGISSDVPTILDQMKTYRAYSIDQLERIRIYLRVNSGII